MWSVFANIVCNKRGQTSPFFSLLLGLRYRQIVTLNRVFLMVIAFWAMSIFAAAMYFSNYLVTLSFGYIIVSLCVTISILSYAKIFYTLHRHHSQVQDHVHAQQQPSQTNPLNIARYRKVVTSALWLQLTLIVCYLPHGIVEALLTYLGLSSAAVLG